MREAKNCTECGAKIVEHGHTISLVLASALRKFAKAGEGPHHIRDEALRLDYSEIANFQKLRYWGFVSHDGLRQGVWEITESGYEALAGATFPRKVWTYRGDVVQVSEERITLAQAAPYVPQHDDYVAEMRPHEEAV